MLQRIDGRPNANERRGTPGRLFVARMPAALRRHLILDHDAGDPALNVKRIAVAGVGIADNGEGSRLADVLY